MAREPMNGDQAARVAALLKALADPVRLQLLSLVASHEGGEACVCDLNEAFDLSQPTISHHLKVLHRNGLLERSKRGVWVYYKVQADVLDSLGKLISSAAHERSRPAGLGPTGCKLETMQSAAELPLSTTGLQIYAGGQPVRGCRMRILVGFAGVHGSTEQIAQRIAGTLRQGNMAVDVAPLEQAPGPEAYDAVVLGSAIHNQSWLPAASGFVHRHQAGLLSRPVWLFSVGMSDGLPRLVRHAARAGQDRRLADALRDLVRPRGHALFSGVCRADQLPRWAGFLFRCAGGRFGDYRDWAQIDGWARGITRSLGAASPTTRES
jgi:menaquinone-dependent protoporphyrinogen oxidase